MAKSIIKCPHCGSTSVFRKAPSSETTAAQRTTWQCGNCHKKFGFLSFTQEKASGRRVLPVGKNYENVVCVGFSVSGYFGGYDQTIIVRGNHGSALCAIHTPFDVDDDDLFIREFSDREWKALMQKLFEKLFIHEWKKSYVDNRVCDGTQWEISIQFSNQYVYTVYGSNAYPALWNDAEKYFIRYTREAEEQPIKYEDQRIYRMFSLGIRSCGKGSHRYVSIASKPL